MFIALTVPKDHELLNLAAVAYVKEFPQQEKLEVTLLTGEVKIYLGESASIVKSELAFHFQQYQAFKKQIAGAASGIIAAGGSRQPRPF
jgi:hypothetical protein